MNQLSNPAYLAGKLAYLQGIPENAIRHVNGGPRAAWLDGYRDIQAELVQVRSQITGKRCGVFSVTRDTVLQ